VDKMVVAYVALGEGVTAAGAFYLPCLPFSPPFFLKVLNNK
jgi:hypothetical protein